MTGCTELLMEAILWAAKLKWLEILAHLQLPNVKASSQFLSKARKIVVQISI